MRGKILYYDPKNFKTSTKIIDQTKCRKNAAKI